MSRQSTIVLSAGKRLQAGAVWETLVFLLNGLAFILIGLQLPAVIGALSHVSWPDLLIDAMGISVVVVGVRVAYVFALAYGWWLTVPSRRMHPPPPWRSLTLIGWAGMRGIVSLAAAMALPLTDFPGRDLIIFLSFAVILTTLVFQGLSLPGIIRLLGLADDGTMAVEEREARIDAANAAVARLTAVELEGKVSPALIEPLRHEYTDRLKRLGSRRFPASAVDYSEDEKQMALRREALAAERRMLTFLRDSGVIGDEVLRHLVHELDVEETRTVF